MELKNQSINRVPYRSCILGGIHPPTPYLINGDITDIVICDACNKPVEEDHFYECDCRTDIKGQLDLCYGCTEVKILYLLYILYYLIVFLIVIFYCIFCILFIIN